MIVNTPPPQPPKHQKNKNYFSCIVLHAGCPLILIIQGPHLGIRSNFLDGSEQIFKQTGAHISPSSVI